MRKKIISLVAVTLLMVPVFTQANEASTAPQILPAANSLATFEFSLNEKLKDILKPFIDKALAEQTGEDSEELRVLADILLAQKPFFVHANTAAVNFSVETSEEQFNTLVKNAKKTTSYEGVDIYEKEGSAFIGRINNIAIIADGEDAESFIKKTIDIHNGTSTDSLANDPVYLDMTKDFLSPKMAGLTINFEEILKYVNSQSGDPTAGLAGSINSILDWLKYESFSFGEIPTGYKFNIKVKGLESKMREKGLKMNEGGNFTPTLYKKMPNAKPIFYAENFNLKANMAVSTKLLNDAYSKAGLNIESIYAEIDKVIGMKFESIYNLFDQEFALAVQSKNDSPLPYITLMANVSNTKAEAEKILNILNKKFQKMLAEEEELQGYYSIEKKDGFTFYKLNTAKINEENSSSLPEIAVAAGIDSEGMLIISNYPNMQATAAHTGFANDPDFSPYISQMNEVQAVSYFNVRNVWAASDNVLNWLPQIDPNFLPDLDFYQGYYSVLNAIYAWKDLFMVTTGNDFEATTTGTITIDSEKHDSYADFIESLKTKDSDKDGVSDYEEFFVYKTPVFIGDSNNDGVSDMESLEKGIDPEEGNKIFEDVGEKEFYTRDVAMLKRQGIVSGYGDGSFKPGRTVSRAEFTAMIVKAFDSASPTFFNSGLSPFADVSQNEWYYKPIAKAYSAGIIAGSFDSAGRRVFRPGDNITRGEALAILAKASEALNKSAEAKPSCKSAPFKDVSEKDWFCSAVANGYANGITKGKEPKYFRPFDNLTRGEAAVMIKRTLEKDMLLTEEAKPLTDVLGEGIEDTGVGTLVPVF